MVTNNEREFYRVEAGGGKRWHPKVSGKITIKTIAISAFCISTRATFDYNFRLLLPFYDALQYGNRPLPNHSSPWLFNV